MSYICLQRISPDQHITSSLAVNPTVNTRNITCLLPNFCDLWSGVRQSAVMFVATKTVILRQNMNIFFTLTKWFSWFCRNTFSNSYSGESDKSSALHDVSSPYFYWNIYSHNLAFPFYPSFSSIISRSLLQSPTSVSSRESWTRESIVLIQTRSRGFK